MEEDGDRADDDEEHHSDDGQEEGSGGGGIVFPKGHVADQEAYAPGFVPATAGLQDPHGAARIDASVTSSAPAYQQTITSAALGDAGHVFPFVDAPYAKAFCSPLHRELLDPSEPPCATSTGQAVLVPYSSPSPPASGSGHGESDWGSLQREIAADSQIRSAASASPDSHLASSPSGGYSPTPSISSLFLPSLPSVYAPYTSSSSFKPAAMSAPSAELVPYPASYTPASPATYPLTLPTGFLPPSVAGAGPSAPGAADACGMVPPGATSAPSTVTVPLIRFMTTSGAVPYALTGLGAGFVPSVDDYSHIPLPSLAGAVQPGALPHAHRAPPLRLGDANGYQELRMVEPSSSPDPNQAGVAETSSSSATTGPSSYPIPADVYKTRLCRTFMRSGVCRSSPNCTFAHGEEELREVGPCRYFRSGNTCPRGARCRYRHC